MEEEIQKVIKRIKKGETLRGYDIPAKTIKYMENDSE